MLSALSFVYLYLYGGTKLSTTHKNLFFYPPNNLYFIR